MRKPFKKTIADIPVETAHGGSGKRQLLLGKDDPVSSMFEAFTKGFLEPGGCFDWHSHADVDEFFIALKGEGVIDFEDGTTFPYAPGDIVYIPSNISHRITAAAEENQFYFFRLTH